MANAHGNPHITSYGHSTRFGAPNGNPSGRKPGVPSIYDRLNKYMNLETSVVLPDGSRDKREVLDCVVLAMLSKACQGDMNAIKEVLDRYYGKVSDKIELTGKDGEALQVNHTAHLETLYAGISDAFEVKAIEDK